MEKLVLIDGHSILNRAFYGVPGLTNSEGLHTNAVYGFFNILFKLLEEEKPGYLAVAFDLKAPTFRHTMYDAYKGTRKPMPEELHEQVPLMKEVLTAMGIPIFTREGYEADDILGTVAKKAQAFGAVTRYYDPFRLSPEMEQQWQLSFEPLEELLATSDIITLHVPLTEENHHMIGAREIAAMKDGAILINTSRGGLVDDKALAKAVRSGKLSGAGLDVVEEEPLPACHELLSDPNIIVTPHIGGGTADIGDVIIPMLTEDIKALADGRTPAHVVNKEYMVH